MSVNVLLAGRLCRKHEFKLERELRDLGMEPTRQYHNLMKQFRLHHAAYPDMIGAAQVDPDPMMNAVCNLTANLLPVVMDKGREEAMRWADADCMLCYVVARCGDHHLGTDKSDCNFEAWIGRAAIDALGPRSEKTVS